MPVIVKNINRIEPALCQCGSWLRHWRNFSNGAMPNFCAEATCLDKPTVGALVQTDRTTDRSWYVIPLCGEHAKATHPLRVADITCFVPADISATCGRQGVGSAGQTLADVLSGTSFLNPSDRSDQ